jgi:SAM-dependent methyltransferase
MPINFDNFFKNNLTMNNSSSFLSIDPEFYRLTYQNLREKTDNELLLHYYNSGEEEGQVASPFATQQGLLSIIHSGESVLEIGPFANPLTKGEGVKYFDVLDRSALIKRALEVGYLIDNIPEIDYVSKDGDLSIIEESYFDFVVSSHCIEHQPDLIEHINQVSRILKPGGMYLLLIPDKRYCFDHFLAESTTVDVIQAHFDKRTSHKLASLIEHRLLLTHNDSVRHWRGDHGQLPVIRDSTALNRVFQEYITANGNYIDVHAWQFTPRSFLDLSEQLHSAELINLIPRHVFGTPHNTNTFCAALCNP